jgi:protoporphyrinogen IX oxidase
MPWFLVLHIISLLFWCGALLYLPVLLAGMQAGNLQIRGATRSDDSMPRFVFTHIATPAALLAIVFGTLVFLRHNIVEVWLVVKLTLVVGLVSCHALAGSLIKRFEDRREEPIRLWCWSLQAALCGFMVAITWIVLAKPPAEALWPF